MVTFRAMTISILLWIVALALIAAGLVGTVRPFLPGPILIFAGILLAAWIDQFQKIGWWTIGFTGVLLVLSFFADTLLQTLGAKRANASPLAVTGAAVGTFAGAFLGPVGLFALPLVGAMVGDFATNRSILRAGKVGIATAIGTVAGTAARLAISFAMIGFFVAALLL